jgi:hypothetical protein
MPHQGIADVKRPTAKAQVSFCRRLRAYEVLYAEGCSRQVTAVRIYVPRRLFEHMLPILCTVSRKLWPSRCYPWGVCSLRSSQVGAIHTLYLYSAMSDMGLPTLG